MKKFVRQHMLTAIGILLGAIGGYLYWRYVGCSSGTCAITSRPLNSTVYGAAMGGLFLSLFRRDSREQKRKGA